MGTTRSGLERAEEEGKAHIHAVVYVGMVVVELFVGMLDPRLRQALGQDARSIVNVELVAPAAVDIDALERLEIGTVGSDEMDGVVLEPIAPARPDRLAALHVERNAESQRCALVGIVGRRHADVHDGVALGHGKLLLVPYVVEEALDSPVVAPLAERLALA